MRVRIDIVQADPDAEAGERFHQFGHARLDRAAVPESGAVFDIDAIGAGVLRNHQQFLHTCFDEVVGFLHHIANRTADQIATHRGNNAKSAAMIAALRDFQIGVVFGREFDTNITRWRHQIDVRIVFMR